MVLIALCLNVSIQRHSEVGGCTIDVDCDNRDGSGLIDGLGAEGIHSHCSTKGQTAFDREHLCGNKLLEQDRGPVV